MKFNILTASKLMSKLKPISKKLSLSSYLLKLKAISKTLGIDPTSDLYDIYIIIGPSIMLKKNAPVGDAILPMIILTGKFDTITKKNLIALRKLGININYKTYKNYKTITLSDTLFVVTNDYMIIVPKGNIEAQLKKITSRMEKPYPSLMDNPKYYIPLIKTASKYNLLWLIAFNPTPLKNTFRKSLKDINGLEIGINLLEEDELNLKINLSLPKNKITQFTKILQVSKNYLETKFKFLKNKISIKSTYSGVIISVNLGVDNLVKFITTKK